ncbi:MAG: LysM peptidoglycan-binding domain-containing protein [Saprospiraceae bacterium]|jgi:flagellum-specific peptidoglycan hydrolase FlgJ/LysM repeat protein|nr:LysM peptidoglycan-binding domain-containing protein [Saprospiraceae bacterium]
MRNVFLFVILAAMLAQSCDVLRQSGSGSSSSSGKSSKGTGLDKTVMSPTEYSTQDRNLDYITKFSRAAALSMDRIGVPASIVLAQGVLESAAGTSDLATAAKNHFGIKCGGNWSGKTYKKKDDDRDKDGNLIESCFRSYETVEESFVDHGQFLRDPRKATRYSFLFNLDRTDYKGWARGLQSAGYATAPDYADKLINLIERYKLYQYDTPGSRPNTFPTEGGGQGEPATPVGPNAPGQKAEATGRIGRVNDVKVVASRDGETLEDVARAFRLNTQKVVDYNDRGYPPGVKLKTNTRIFIQCKGTKWHGRSTEHTVREGQTMFDIAQVYGIQLEKLLAMNGMRRGQEPEANETVAIRGKNKRPIKIKDESDATPSKATDWPGSKPKPDTSPIVEDGELDFEIGPGAPNTAPEKPKPQPEKPATTGTKPGQKPPATSTDRPYEDDPYPNTGTAKPPYEDPYESEKPAPRGYHRVVKGDTLYKLSRDYGLTVDRLKQINKLENSDIKIGQLLKVQ